MRLVRRALAGAAASLALGALFTGVALGAEPSAEADADATINVGMGADDGSTLDVGLDGILGVNDEAGTDAVLDLDGDAALVGSPTATDSTAGADLALGTATDGAAVTEAIDVAAPDADASASIHLGATQASLAGAGMNAGSVMNIDLDAGRADAVGSSADASVDLGAGTDATDTSSEGDATLTLGAGTDAADSSAGTAGTLSLGAGTDAADTGVDGGLSLGSLVTDVVAWAAEVLSLNGLVPDLTDIGAIEGLSLESLGSDVANASTDAGSDEPTGAVDTVTSLIRGAVLGIQARGPDAAPVRSGGSADADLSITPGGSGGFLPDTAFGPGTDVALWGLLLVILAGLWATGGALPARRR